MTFPVLVTKWTTVWAAAGQGTKNLHNSTSSEQQQAIPSPLCPARTALLSTAPKTIVPSRSAKRALLVRVDSYYSTSTTKYTMRLL